MTATGT